MRRVFCSATGYVPVMMTSDCADLNRYPTGRIDCRTRASGTLHDFVRTPTRCTEALQIVQAIGTSGFVQHFPMYPYSAPSHSKTAPTSASCEGSPTHKTRWYGTQGPAAQRHCRVRVFLIFREEVPSSHRHIPGKAWEKKKVSN